MASSPPTRAAKRRAESPTAAAPAAPSKRTERPADAAATDTAAADRLSADEAALYDRQIRLWGFSAQARLRAAHVLVVGFEGPAPELIKNLVLSGVGALTVLDDAVAVAADLAANFFLTAAETAEAEASPSSSSSSSSPPPPPPPPRVVAARARIQELNPRVQIIPVVAPPTSATLADVAAAVAAPSSPVARIANAAARGPPTVVVSCGTSLAQHRHWSRLCDAARLPCLVGTTVGLDALLVCQTPAPWAFETEAAAQLHEAVAAAAATASAAKPASGETPSAAPTPMTVAQPTLETALLSASFGAVVPPLTPAQQKRLASRWSTALGPFLVAWHADAVGASGAASAAPDWSPLIAAVSERLRVPLELLPTADAMATWLPLFRAGTTIAPVSAIAGGLLAQEAQKLVTRIGRPLDNVCLFAGDTNDAKIMRLGESRSP
ncbi:hypothetical protein CXG81DRAFT_24905 [Caulochytrium protostelioides]|uniref:THIF-type NAD/FAD binding fold domain-containing protein n=1 Tax=Caulochytrium protostelioides TaxID=1555241 RepID=A0A4P9XAP1_9FUNG|nr:hypothetical protein CXG81DRAFT_24905 [Caulochytrium protostelioides]|eukprot:RKP02444.1 hypothetical protein CXG81DRAFT_24905 [Caulochytrium protostelioides]